MEQNQPNPTTPTIDQTATQTIDPLPSQIEPTPKKSHKKLIIFIFFVLIFITVTTLSTFYWWKTRNNKSTKKLSREELVTTLKSGAMPQFAEFLEETVTTEPKIPDYTINLSEISNLTEVENANLFVTGKESKFNQDQLNSLINPGFFITKAKINPKLTNGDEYIDNSQSDEFLMLYGTIQGAYAKEFRKPENAVFISSDLLLHIYHVYIDRTFQHIEETQLQPKLLSMTNMLYEQALSQYQQTDDTQLKNSLSRVSAFFLIPKVILETSQQPITPQNSQEIMEMEAKDDEDIDTNEKILANFENYKNQLPAEIYDSTLRELQLILEAQKAQPSPIFGEFRIVNNNQQIEDYTQFKPRSHYTKNSILRSYWKAMIWYGRGSFLTKSNELTLDAMVQSILLNSTSKNEEYAITLWEDIYLPTVFFVGQSDDLTVYDYLELISNVYGEKIHLDDLTNENKLTQFKQELANIKGPAIQSSIIAITPNGPSKDKLLDETKSFRLMGQRFIPDSYIFSELTQGDEAPDPETNEKLPPIPTALMPMSIFGNTRATLHLEDWTNQNASDSKKVLSKEIARLDNEFNQFNQQSWTQNLYWSWLYTLQSLWGSYGKGYPQFMQNTAWEDKSLYTTLGSWTELRHDTLLYAKQSYAEMGGGRDLPETPPVPKGYVEPNLQFLNRLIALAKMTETGLSNTGVLDEPAKARIEGLIESFEYYRDFAVKELNNEIISEEEFEKLRTSASIMNSHIRPYSSSNLIAARDARAGIIADVHTATTEDVQEILYEATGVPNIIYVVVSDANGTRLTRGVTYSYYEFTRPFGERLSDEDWQANIYEADTSFTTPQTPNWISNIQN